MPSKDTLKSSIRGASVELAGMPALVKFLGYMGTREKNTAVRRAYRVATTKYRSKLKAATPEGDSGSISGIKQLGKSKGGKLGKRSTSLKKSVGFIPSKKYSKSFDLISPVWVGHLVKKGAYHQHFVVLGRPAIQADGSALHKGQRPKGGSRKKAMSFVGSEGENVATKGVKAQKAEDYVSPIASRFKDVILDDFGDSFIKAMRKEAHKPKYQGYLK